MDKKALKILFSVYWSSGWKGKTDRGIAAADFAYAKNAGVAFDPVRLSHDEVVRRAIAARDSVQTRDVADAFLASLSSRRLEWRSSLATFSLLQHFPNHTFLEREHRCSVCGAYNHPDFLEDLSVLNFERYKWGGVRHDQPLYAAFDLERFVTEERPVPGTEDIKVFHRVIAAIDSAPKETTSAQLGVHLAKVLNSNKGERDVLIGILGMCGILAPSSHPGYFGQFVPCSQRELPARRYADMHYPACWWTRADGIDRNALKHFFGHVL
jgi:hypothetical protein